MEPALVSNPHIEVSRATEDLSVQGRNARQSARSTLPPGGGDRPFPAVFSRQSTANNEDVASASDYDSQHGTPFRRQDTHTFAMRASSAQHRRPFSTGGHHHQSGTDTEGEDEVDTETARLERRVHKVMHVKQFFLAYHVAYILLAALICTLVIFTSEKENKHLDTRTTFMDAFFISVSGVTCTGLLPVNTKNFGMASVIVWHVTVFLGSTVFTSIAPSLLRIETLKLLRKLEADSITPLRRKHIHRLLRTSRIMVIVTLSYAVFFFAIGMCMLGGSLGFGEGLLRTISAFGNAGFITDPPRKFYTQAVNFFAVAIVVPAGSTLFPVFLRPYLTACGLAYQGYVRLATKLAPSRRVWGDPHDWNTEEVVTVVAAQRKVDEEGNVTFEDDNPHASNDFAPPSGGASMLGTPPVEAAEQPALQDTRPPIDEPPLFSALPAGNEDNVTVAPSSAPTTVIPSTRGALNGPHDDDDSYHPRDERAPLLGIDRASREHLQSASYGSDAGAPPSPHPSALPNNASLATASPRQHDDGEPYTGLQNLSILADDDVAGEVVNRRLQRNEVLKSFALILASKKPVNHHPWLFVAADTTYLLVAWLLIVLFQFMPFTFQQWNATGVLADQPNEFMKAVVAFTQSACNRFSGIAFFDFNRLSPAQICTILFALYIPALPIPTERTKRRWKEMFSGGFFRLLLSRFWWLFTATLLIVLLEEGHSYKYIDGYFDHFHYAPSLQPRPVEESAAEFGSSSRRHAQREPLRFTTTQYHGHRRLNSSDDLSANAGPVIPDWQMRNGTWDHGVLTRTLFEVLSAYATAGLSLQLPESTGSLSSSYTVWSQLIIVLCMIAGRHRNMDLGLDIGLTDLAATSKRDPERAKRTAHDFDLGSLRVPLDGSLRPGSPASSAAAGDGGGVLAAPQGAFWIFGSLNRRQSSTGSPGLPRRHRRLASEPFALGRHSSLAGADIDAADVDQQVPRADTNTDIGDSPAATAFGDTWRSPTTPGVASPLPGAAGRLDFPSDSGTVCVVTPSNPATPSAAVPADAPANSSSNDHADTASRMSSSHALQTSERSGSIELTPQQSARGPAASS